MRLVLSMPQIYTFKTDFTDVEKRGLLPIWAKWGWCLLSDVTGLVEDRLQRRLVCRDVLLSFGIEKGRNKLLVMENGPGFSGRIREYARRDLDSYCLHYDMYVPAGWVKNILFSIDHGACQFRFRNGDAVACDSDGQMIMVF